MEKQTLGEIAAQKLLGMIQEKAIRPEISCPRKRSWWNFWEWDGIRCGRPCAS